MKDITTRKDIEVVINFFYEKVQLDKSIGPFFNEIATLNFKTHLPVMYDFWESIIFKKGTYTGNPMISHILLYQKKKIENFHFERWLLLWEQALTTHFSGPNTNEAFQRAKQIARLIQYKLTSTNI